VLVPRSEEPAYRVFVRASFAEYLAEWLLDAAAEYRGVAPLDLTAPVFMRLRTRVPDRPGGLAGLLAAVATAGANVIELSHVRDDADLPLAQTASSCWSSCAVPRTQTPWRPISTRPAIRHERRRDRGPARPEAVARTAWGVRPSRLGTARRARRHTVGSPSAQVSGRALAARAATASASIGRPTA
jgi:hypothetical protein